MMRLPGPGPASTQFWPMRSLDMEYLVVNKTEVLLTKGHLESGLIRNQQQVCVKEQEQAAEPGEKVVVMPDSWHSTYTICKSIPKYYIAHWLVANTSLDQDTVDRIDAFHPQALRLVFGSLTGLHDTTWWPPRLHVRVVLTAWLRWQFEQLKGELRVRDLLRALSSNGRIDYEKLLPYELAWSRPVQGTPDEFDGVPEQDLPYLKTLTHKYFEHTVTVKGQRIDPVNWDISAHLSDVGAAFNNLSNSTIKPTFASFFGAKPPV
ncbi:unnamed protein product [Prorocentrum cordatum]|uniref:Uncharacterized protein n=1 Tax=Prorocentrum cordatum TaxID=2364126 RepID=A0ABN9X2V5_9DINO|nr:unnamed protein product [Polarella glacialis]